MSRFSDTYEHPNVRVSLNRLVNGLYQYIGEHELANLDDMNLEILLKDSQTSIQKLLKDFERASELNR